MAREVVRRIQAIRKEAGFDIADRITTFYQASSEFNQVFKDWASYIMSETLTTELTEGEPPASFYSETQQVDGQQITLAIKQNK